MADERRSDTNEGVKEQREIADSCRRQQWSIAIRLLSSLPNVASSATLLCNRALCNLKLELYKHAVKDCNNALVLNPCILQAYLFKGEAMVAMGKREEGQRVWLEGYEIALSQPSDLQTVLQLHNLATGNSASAGDISHKNLGPAPVQAAERAVQPVRKEVAAVPGTAAQRQGTAVNKRPLDSVPPVITVDINLARGIAQVNAGNYEEAVRIFTQLMSKNTVSASALIGRGSAYAFQRKLEAAIEDFTKAVELEPSAVEAWKRRGQARAAVGLNSEALTDLSKALELEPKASDILYEKGVVYYKMKDFESSIMNLRSALGLDSTNRYAYNYYGLALTSTGEYTEAMDAYNKAVKLDPSFKEAWSHLAKLHKELGDPDKAFTCIQQILKMDEKYVHAYRLKGLLLYGLGNHRGAAKELTIGLEMDPQNLDLLYLRGSCYHAIGRYAEAVKDYEDALDGEVTSADNRTLQFLAFYQRETALYMASKGAKPFEDFNIDGDFDPNFKEAWCKRLSPMVVLSSSSFRPLQNELIKNALQTRSPTALTKPKKTLLEYADRLGQLIQYNCPGFLKNARQHRMAGLAVLEVAQKVSTLLKSSSFGTSTSSNSGKSSKGDKTEGQQIPLTKVGKGSTNGLAWRDVYSIAVKWRQASEPCDPVVWVDKLSEKEFAAGFGSHTPMLLGQARVVRYYPNFPRALEAAKSLIMAQRKVYNAANEGVAIVDPMKLREVGAAVNCKDLYSVVGEDFWIVTPCQSIAKDGKVLDGTRFTLQKNGANGYDFSIRTPCTPPRWTDYDEELAAAWERYCNLYGDKRREPENSSRVQKQLQDCILRLSFYWYNFMPLARGTAVVGYIMLLGLFLAADLEVTASIPNGVQVDWEAILSRNLKMFVEAVRPWLYPSLKKNASWRDLPKVSETFNTVSSIVAALSSNY